MRPSGSSCTTSKPVITVRPAGVDDPPGEVRAVVVPDGLGGHLDPTAGQRRLHLADVHGERLPPGHVRERVAVHGVGGPGPLQQRPPPVRVGLEPGVAVGPDPVDGIHALTAARGTTVPVRPARGSVPARVPLLATTAQRRKPPLSSRPCSSCRATVSACTAGGRPR